MVSFFMLLLCWRDWASYPLEYPTFWILFSHDIVLAFFFLPCISSKLNARSKGLIRFILNTSEDYIIGDGVISIFIPLAVLSLTSGLQWLVSPPWSYIFPLLWLESTPCNVTWQHTNIHSLNDFKTNWSFSESVYLGVVRWWFF